MGLLKVSLQEVLHNWEARKLMTAHTQAEYREEINNSWPHPLTHEKRKHFKQGLRSLV